MRRILMFNRVSADGYFATEDGNLAWATPDPELDQAAASRLGDVGTILFGRKTYDAFESFWPHALDEDPHAPGRKSKEIRAMGQWINDAEKIVFSRTRKEVPWKNSVLHHDFDPAAVAAMKRGRGADMIIFGSGTIVSLLTKHGLIDDYEYVVCPLLLGNGQSMIRGLPASTNLKLVESKATAAGNVVLRYTRA